MRRLAFLTLVVIGLLSVSGPVGAQSLPTAVFGTGYQVTPSAALTYYGSMTSPTRVSDEDVKRLAKALGNDIDRIYAFVHDDVDVLWMFGLKAGARGVIIDKAGTPFDQTNLMVELAREAGFSARYRWGTITPTLAEMLEWTGVSNQTALEKLLKDGSFPYEVYVDGGTTRIRMLHMWAEVTISGTAYAFDPAFKAYDEIAGMNIDTASGFNPTTFINGAIATATNTSDANGVRTRGLSRTSVQTSLQTAATNLQGQIQSTVPNGDIEDVIGGRDIQAFASPPAHITSLPYQETVSATWTDGVPVKLRTRATVQFYYSGGGPLSFAWYADEIYGEQLVFEPIPDKGAPTDPSQFRFKRGDTALTGWLPGVIPGPSVVVDHPYASPATSGGTLGLYMDRTVSMGGGGISGSLQVMLGFGRPSKDLAAWQEARTSPVEGETIIRYGTEGEEIAPISNQTAQRRRMIAAYLGQLSEASGIIEGVGDAVVQQHDTLGFVTSTFYPGTAGPPAATTYLVGVEAGVSATALDGSATGSQAALRTYALMVPTLEGSLSEQMGSAVYTVSTPAKFDWALDGPSGSSNQLYYYATSANWTWVKSQILNDLGGASPVKAIAESYITAGFTVIIPRSSNLGPGASTLTYCLGSGCTITGPDRGGAFIAIHPDGRMAHIISLQYGMAKGGGGGNDAQTVPGKVFAIPEDFKDRQFTSRAENFDVDLKTGVLAYSPPADLTVGTGSYPYSLSFQRTFRSGSVQPVTASESYSPEDPQFAETGWTSNLNHIAKPSSDAMAAFGNDDPRTAASTIMAVRAMLATSPDGTGDLQTLQRQIIANMSAWWWTRTLVLNTVIVQQGDNSRSFVKLPDGTWSPPRGADETLQVQGTRLLVDPTIGPDFWTYRTICVRLTGSDRSITSFGPSSWAAPYNLANCPTTAGSANPIGESFYKGAGFRRQTFPYGVQVDRTANGGLSNNLGRSLVVSANGVASGTINFSIGDGEDPTRTVALLGSADAAGTTETMELSVTDTESHTWNVVADGQSFRATPPSAPDKPYLIFDFRPGVRGVVDRFHDANRNTTTYQIASFRAAATQDPLGASTYLRFDPFGQPVTTIDRLGRVTRNAYDNHRRLTRVTRPEGNSEEYAYDSRSNRTETRLKPKPGGSPPADIVTSATYHATFNVPLTETDALGRVTTYAYNATTGLLTSITQPTVTEGTPVTSFTWNSLGQRLTRTDPTGLVLRYTYDAENYLDTVTDSYGVLNLVSSFDYDAAGNITSLTDPRGKVHTATWDKLRRITRWTAPASTGAETRWTYDVDGLVSEIKQATGLASPNDWAVTTLAYETTARVRAVTDPDGRVTRFLYDALNRPVLTIDAEGRTVGSVYDAEGQVLQERRGDGSTAPIVYAARTWTANGKLLTVADANPATTTYLYDPFDRLSRSTYPNPANGAPYAADYEELTYDAQSNVTARRTRSGLSITMAYDALDRLSSKTVPASGAIPARTATFVYDLAGRQDVVSETGGHVLDWAFDGAKRPASVAISGPQWTGSKTVSYQYDASSNRTRLTWPDGYYVTYAYDDLNRLDTATQTVSGVSTLLADFTWDPLSRRTGAALDAAGAGGSIAAAFTKAGDLTGVTHGWTGGGGVTVTYAYDLAHKLKDETFSDAAYRWTPASFGTDAYDADYLNRYATARGATLSYDANQNLSGDGTWTWTYDPENRMVSAGKSGQTAAYAYDPLGRRVKKTATGAVAITESYLLDGDEEIAEYDAAGALVRRFVPSGATDAPIVQVEAAGTRKYFRVNRQDTVMAMTGSTGTLLDGPFEYDPYGAPNPADITAGSTPFRYTGRRYDLETGLYYYRARYYSAAFGRFMQTDPVGYGGGINLYGYADGDPANESDPSGLAPPRSTNANCTFDCDPCVKSKTCAPEPGPVRGSVILGGTVTASTGRVPRLLAGGTAVASGGIVADGQGNVRLYATGGAATDPNAKPSLTAGPTLGVMNGNSQDMAGVFTSMAVSRGRLAGEIFRGETADQTRDVVGGAVTLNILPGKSPPSASVAATNTVVSKSFPLTNFIPRAIRDAINTIQNGDIYGDDR